MAQINHKAVRSLSKLMEAGFDSEKAVLNMTMDDVLSLPGITVAEIGMINAIQKAGRYEQWKSDLLYRQPGEPAFFTSGQFFFVSGVWKRGQLLRILPLPQRGTGRNRRKVQEYPSVCKADGEEWNPVSAHE